MSWLLRWESGGSTKQLGKEEPAVERRSWTKPGCCSAHQDLPGRLFQSCCRLVVNIFALINNNCLDDSSKAAAQVDGGAPEQRHKLVRGQLRGALNRHWSPGRGGGSNLILRYGGIQGRGGERMEEMIGKILKHFPRHRSLLSFRNSLQEVTLIL